MPVSDAFNGADQAAQHKGGVYAPGYRARATVANGEKWTIELQNATEAFKVKSDVDVLVYVHPDAEAAQKSTVNGNLLWEPFVEQTIKVIIENASGGDSGTLGVEFHATLSEISASEFVELSEASGFDGVESNASSTVA